MPLLPRAVRLRARLRSAAFVIKRVPLGLEVFWDELRSNAAIINEDIFGVAKLGDYGDSLCILASHGRDAVTIM